MRRIDTLENRPWRLRAPFVSLVLLCLPACQGEGESASEPLPTGEIASIEISPKAVLLTDDIDSKQLHIRAYDAEGREVRADGLDLEWVDADPGAIALVPGDENSASVSAIAGVGSGIIVARSKTRTDLLSNPVIVRAAVLDPEVVALDDKDIVFPPPNHPFGTDMLDLPGFGLNADGKISVGEFELAELLLSLTTSGAEDPRFDDKGAMLKDPAARLRYPVVIARDAYVPGMTRVLGAESSPIAGNVLQAVERGEWVGLMVEAASPSEIYEELHIEFDGPALQERGLLNLQSLVARSSPPGAGFRSGTPDWLKPYNEGDCVSGDVSGVGVNGVGVNVTMTSVLPPKGIFDIHSKVKHIKWVGGHTSEVAIRPELNAQAAGSLTASCYIGDEVNTAFGLSALTGSLLDGRLKLKPRLDLKFEVGAGPRFNAYALFLCNTTMSAGFEYKDGEGLKWSDADGEFNKFVVDCKPPEYDMTLSTGYKFDDFGGISRADGGMDGFFNLEGGLAMETKIAILLGGVVMDNLMDMAARTKDAEKVVHDMAERFANSFPLPFNAPPLPAFWQAHLDQLTPNFLTVPARKLLSAILSLADVDFLKIDFGVSLKLRLESTQRILSEADGGSWFADQHQVFGVQFPVKLEVGLLDLEKLFKALFPDVPALHVVPSLTITAPPLDAISFYRGIHPAGSITSMAIKGPGNKGEDFEVHDRLQVKVPGAYPGTGIDLSGDSKIPIGGAIFIRDSITDGGKLGVRYIGALKYVGPEGANLMFEGEIDVEDKEIRDHLIARKELYFMAYNQLFGFSVPGYLNSYNAYDITPIALDVDVTPAVVVGSAEHAKSIKPLVTLTNKSVRGETPIDVVVEIGPVPAWITVPFKTAPLAADGQLGVLLAAKCESKGPKSAIIALKIKHTVEKPMMAPKVYDADEQIEVKLDCTEPVTPEGENPPPAFVGTQCPAVGNQVDYAALDAELETYQNKDQLQFGIKLLPASPNECKPSVFFELPVPCGKYVDYQLWKMGGSTSENDLGFGTPYFIWNPHYAADGMWEAYGLIDMEPVSLLSEAQQTSRLVPCDDARMDPLSGPTGPIITDSEHPNMIRAFSKYPRNEPDLSWPENYQECYDIVEMKAGNLLGACSEGTTSGALYIVVQPKLVVGSH